MLMFESFAWLDSQYEPLEDIGQELIGFPYRLQAGWVFLEILPQRFLEQWGGPGFLHRHEARIGPEVLALAEFGAEAKGPVPYVMPQKSLIKCI